jgi:hypothetical protein
VPAGDLRSVMVLVPKFGVYTMQLLCTWLTADTVGPASPYIPLLHTVRQSSCLFQDVTGGLWQVLGLVWGLVCERLV